MNLAEAVARAGETSDERELAEKILRTQGVHDELAGFAVLHDRRKPGFRESYYGFESFTDFVRQQIKSYTDNNTWFENKAPGYTAFRKAVDTVPIDAKGYRLPAITGRPGGHTGYLPSASNFNPAIGAEASSMYVFPTYYALPMVFQGQMIRTLRKAPEKLMDFNDALKAYMEAATKRMEYLIYGDGSGALAFSSSTLSVGAFRCGAAGPGPPPRDTTAVVAAAIGTSTTPRTTRPARRLRRAGVARFRAASSTARSRPSS